jgi:membrane associated rhomboid family serine protease
MQGSPQLAMPPFRGVVKILVLTCCAVFLLQLLGQMIFHEALEPMLGFVPGRVFQGWLWQFFTYSFLHSGVFHILFNMLILWSLGSELELRWGAQTFVAYYFVCALGAALLYGALSLVGMGMRLEIPLIGASGAIYGLLLAYGILFGDRVMYFFMVFPMPAKYFVLILGVVEFVSSISSGADGVAHTAHLGGMFTGFLFLAGMAQWRQRKKRENEGREERKKRLEKAGHLQLVTKEEDDPKHWH